MPSKGTTFTKNIIIIIILMLSGSKSFRVGLAVTSRLASNIKLTVAPTIKKKTRKETNLKFYKIIAVPVLLYGSETWTLRKRLEQNSSGRDEIFKNSLMMH
jgi:hypothetical protein